MTTGFSPAVLLVLSIVTAGYILATNCFRFRYQTARESGHRLYLTCATLGGLLTFVSCSLVFVTQGVACFLLEVGELQDYLSLDVLLSGASVLNVPLAIGGSRLYNGRRGVKARNLSRAWQKDDFSSLLDYATHSGKLISFTLDNRKVYIGLITRTNEPHWESSHVTLLPLYSGYREEEDLSLVIKNTYEEVFDYFECRQSGRESSFTIEDFYIVIPLSKIASSHIFNPEIFHRVNGGRVGGNLLSKTVDPFS